MNARTRTRILHKASAQEYTYVLDLCAQRSRHSSFCAFILTEDSNTSHIYIAIFAPGCFQSCTSISTDMYMTAACVLLQFAPGTLLVPRSNASTHMDMGMQFDPHSLYVEHHMQPQAQGQQYMSNDSILLQHYAEMAPMGEAGAALQAEPHMHPTSSNFDSERVSGGV